jgi:hypothetical protein
MSREEILVEIARKFAWMDADLLNPIELSVCRLLVNAGYMRVKKHALPTEPDETLYEEFVPLSIKDLELEALTNKE